ncbi:MAG: NAD(+)/NADH kinase [Candidatus Pacearchaeota archaeon]
MKVLVVCKNEDEKDNYELINLVGKYCEKAVYAWKNTLTRKDFEDVDFVISIGGDGTALSASHFIYDKPLLAVNSSPAESVGALTTINIDNLEEELAKIKSGDYKTENLERIEIWINGKKGEHLALNDVFIASEKAYHISRYKLRFKDVEEMQKSSGLIFSTGTGSTAWFRSSGGKPFSPQSKFIKMITREPYCGKNECFLKLGNLEINENEEVEIIPFVKSVLAVDSIRESLLNPGDIVKIKISNNPLKRIL